MQKRLTIIESLSAGMSSLNSEHVLESLPQRQLWGKHWDELQDLGLELEFTENALFCDHRENGFQFNIPYSQAESEKLRRNLFAEIRRCFGSFNDRHLSSLFQPSSLISQIFASFSSLLPLCTQIARTQTAA